MSRGAQKKVRVYNKQHLVLIFAVWLNLIILFLLHRRLMYVLCSVKYLPKEKLNSTQEDIWTFIGDMVVNISYNGIGQYNSSLMQL